MTAPISSAADVRLKSQRVAARGLLAVRHSAGATRIERLIQEGAAKIRLPRGPGPGLEAVLINTAGGLTGGDRLDWEVQVAEGASLTVTTQACEKIYKAMAAEARLSARLHVFAGGRLAWLPQETIVYDRSAFSRTLDVTLAAGASVLLAEATVFGRQAMGETVATARFHDCWRVFAGGRLVHAEDFRLGPDVSKALERRAVADGAIAMATVLCIAPDAQKLLDEARAILGESGGASFWSVASCGKLLARLLAKDGYDLRQRLVPLLSLLNGQAPLPKAWSL